jgi:SAM-dependent methyltransferase
MSESSHSVVLEKKNENFWEEPCGTISLRKNNFENREQFDSWYLNFYPYLGAYIPFKSLAGNQVLEIGLGMGTVSEKLAEKSGSYLGMDVADAPVSLVAQRLNEKKLSGDTVKGNVLTYPFPPNFYDNIISIGCLHHTGNFELALRQVIGALKPGGNAIIMVYNAFSYRQWLFSPLDTFKRWISSGKDYKPHNADAGERFKYDSNSQGESAPFTEFLSSKQIRALLSSYKIEPKIRSENIGSKFFFPIPRKIKLKLFGPWLGLDLYVQFQKPITSDS